jgi:hypothetical protein
VDGEILAKWGGVEAQIKVENRVLARCRSGGLVPARGTALPSMSATRLPVARASASSIEK